MLTDRLRLLGLSFGNADPAERGRGNTPAIPLQESATMRPSSNVSGAIPATTSTASTNAQTTAKPSGRTLTSAASVPIGAFDRATGEDGQVRPASTYRAPIPMSPGFLQQGIDAIRSQANGPSAIPDNTFYRVAAAVMGQLSPGPTAAQGRDLREKFFAQPTGNVDPSWHARAPGDSAADASEKSESLAGQGTRELSIKRAGLIARSMEAQIGSPTLVGALAKGGGTTRAVSSNVPAALRTLKDNQPDLD